MNEEINIKDLIARLEKDVQVMYELGCGCVPTIELTLREWCIFMAHAVYQRKLGAPIWFRETANTYTLLLSTGPVTLTRCSNYANKKD